MKIKNHIWGTAIVVIAGSLICVAIAQDKAKNTTEKSRTLKASNGRFVLGQISDFRSDQFLLDTRTGRLWQSVEMTNEKGVSQPFFRIVLMQETD